MVYQSTYVAGATSNTNTPTKDQQLTAIIIATHNTSTFDILNWWSSVYYFPTTLSGIFSTHPGTTAWSKLTFSTCSALSATDAGFQ